MGNVRRWAGFTKTQSSFPLGLTDISRSLPGGSDKVAITRLPSTHAIRPNQARCEPCGPVYPGGKGCPGFGLPLPFRTDGWRTLARIAGGEAYLALGFKLV